MLLELKNDNKSGANELITKALTGNPRLDRDILNILDDSDLYSVCNLNNYTPYLDQVYFCWRI